MVIHSEGLGTLSRREKEALRATDTVMDSGWVRKNRFEPEPSSWGQVTPLPFVGSDDELLEALHKGHPGAAKACFDRYAEMVDRILTRVLGPQQDDEIPALIETTFRRAIAGAARVQDPARLQGWVGTVAVTVARRHLQRRGRRRFWGRLLGGRAPLAAARPGDGLSRAAHSLYAIFDGMPVDERLVLALRLIDAMPPAEIAEVTGSSLGRLKRRSRRAEARFLSVARRDPVLGPWLDRGARWSLPTLG
jgi:RNA polymerase sigma-70 factor (ECF subfamily)